MIVHFSLALAARLVREGDDAKVCPRNLVGPSDMLLVVPSMRWKVWFGTVDPFRRTMDTHLAV